MPKGNQNLYVQIATPHSDQRSENTVGDYIHDDFRHELALYVDGLLFTGCAHSGLENIKAYQELVRMAEKISSSEE